MAPASTSECSEGTSARLKSGLAEQAQPRSPREHPETMAFLDGLVGHPIGVEHIGHVGDVLGIGGIGVPGPFRVAHAPADPVVAACAHILPKGLRDDVRSEQDRAAGCTVDPGGLDGRGQVALSGEIADGVVDEHRVELAVEPGRPHVADEVFTFGVEGLRERQHLGREVDERHGGVGFQVRGVVAAPAAEFEHGATGRDAVACSWCR